MSSVTQAFRSCLVGVLVLGFAASAWAQAGTASLVGEVTDQQKQVIPGATITLSNRQTGVVQSTVSDERGAFRFVSMRPGRYDMKVELAGFKMSLTEDIPLAVDSTVRQNAILELGGVNETVSVVSQTITLNTTDASLGNAISTGADPQPPDRSPERRATAQPAAGRGLHPGAELRPRGPALRLGRRRPGRSAERHPRRRRRQRHRRIQTAYTSAVRHDAGSAAGVPRQHVELQRRQRPVERPAGVAGHAQRHQPVQRLRLLDVPPDGDVEQRVFPEAGAVTGRARRARRRSWTRTSTAASIGGPIRRNRLFFFGNLERLKEQSESPVLRGVPSNSFRDGVLMYQCAVAAACPGGPVRGFANTHTVAALAGMA